MNTKKIWSKPSVEVTAVRGAQGANFAQADHAGNLKTAANQS